MEHCISPNTTILPHLMSELLVAFPLANVCILLFVVCVARLSLRVNLVVSFPCVVSFSTGVVCPFAIPSRAHVLFCVVRVGAVGVSCFR